MTKHQQGQPIPPDRMKEVEQKMIDMTITALLKDEGLVGKEENLNINDEKKRVRDGGYEVLISRIPNPDGIFDKISVRLAKVVQGAMVSLEAKKENG